MVLFGLALQHYPTHTGLNTKLLAKYKQWSFVILIDVRKMLIPSYLLALSHVYQKVSSKILSIFASFLTSLLEEII